MGRGCGGGSWQRWMLKGRRRIRQSVLGFGTWDQAPCHLLLLRLLHDEEPVHSSTAALCPGIAGPPVQPWYLHLWYKQYLWARCLLSNYTVVNA